ncbi:putative capsular polysaccharide biosynthesis protein YwqC [Lysinibacillus sp. PLM2]|nr:putative capsular polysaccharide biosynthesis protein YwqC [Lysinibacillus sp. PLM2]
MGETINLKLLLKIIKKRLFLISSVMIFGAVVGYILSFYILQPVYQAETQILVNQKISEQDGYVLSQWETELQLIDTYNVIIKSPAIIDKVIGELDLNITSKELSEQISVTNEDNSKVVNLIVEDPVPELAVHIANTVASVFKNEIPNLMSVDNINILSEATLSENPSPIKPNKILIIAIAITMGLIIGVGLVLTLELIDTRIKSEQEVEDLLGLPIIGTIRTVTEKDFNITSTLPSRKRRKK